MSRLKMIAALVILTFLVLPHLYSQASPPYLERSTVDRPDDFTGYQVHVMYVLPSDGIDEELDVNGALATSVDAFQKWLEGQTGGQKLRIDTFEGELDITFSQLGLTEVELANNGPFIRDALEASLKVAGFNDPYKIYAVYYGGNALETCGGGAWPPDLVGTVAAVYLKGTYADPSIRPCADNPLAPNEDTPGYLDFSMLHEIFHTMGIVPECGPNHTRRGHSSDDPSDLMYAGDEGWQPSILDINHDDYYGHGNPDCLDLANSVFMEPTAPDAQIPPGWGAPEIGGILPEVVYETGLCSVLTDPPTNIIFTNVSNRPVDVYWVDYACEEQYMATIQPANSLPMSTFVSHPFHIRDSNTGDLLIEVVPVTDVPFSVTIE